MRCKACNVTLSNRENLFVEKIVDGHKHYGELCSKCRVQSTIEHSIFDKEYDHQDSTEDIDLQ